MIKYNQMETQDFAEWLETELKNRDWRPADLARESGLYAATINRILNRERHAGPETCRAIAHALDIDEVIIFRKAGLLSPLPPAAAEEAKLLYEERKLLNMFQGLAPGVRLTVLTMIQGLSGQTSPTPISTTTELPSHSRLDKEILERFDKLSASRQEESLRLIDRLFAEQEEEEKQRASAERRGG